MADMPPDAYKRMFCVEAAAIEPPIVVEPGATWVGGQTIVVPAPD
jgi:glucose-6-phosphate 1-epimerase